MRFAGISVIFSENPAPKRLRPALGSSPTKQAHLKKTPAVGRWEGGGAPAGPPQIRAHEQSLATGPSAALHGPASAGRRGPSVRPMLRCARRCRTATSGGCVRGSVRSLFGGICALRERSVRSLFAKPALRERSVRSLFGPFKKPPYTNAAFVRCSYFPPNRKPNAVLHATSMISFFLNSLYE